MLKYNRYDVPFSKLDSTANSIILIPTKQILQYKLILVGVFQSREPFAFLSSEENRTYFYIYMVNSRVHESLFESDHFIAEDCAAAVSPAGWRCDDATKK